MSWATTFLFAHSGGLRGVAASSHSDATPAPSRLGTAGPAALARQLSPLGTVVAHLKGDPTQPLLHSPMMPVSQDSAAPLPACRTFLRSIRADPSLRAPVPTQHQRNRAATHLSGGHEPAPPVALNPWARGFTMFGGVQANILLGVNPLLLCVKQRLQEGYGPLNAVREVATTVRHQPMRHFRNIAQLSQGATGQFFLTFLLLNGLEGSPMAVLLGTASSTGFCLAYEPSVQGGVTVRQNLASLKRASKAAGRCWRGALAGEASLVFARELGCVVAFNTLSADGTPAENLSVALVAGAASTFATQLPDDLFARMVATRLSEGRVVRLGELLAPLCKDPAALATAILTAAVRPAALVRVARNCTSTAAVAVALTLAQRA